MTDLPLTGGCNCGAVRFEVTERLVAASYCHCNCQRRGAAASPNAHANWCTPCHAVAPVLERIAEERSLKLVKVHYDEEQGLADRYGVQSIPNIILFEDGAPKAQTIGAQPKSALERASAWRRRGRRDR